MTIFIEASGLGLDYPLYGVNAQTLSNTLLTAAVGGLLMKSRQNVVIRALSNVNLHLVQGDRLALVGHNGSGKTSLLKVLAGVYSPSAGTLKVGGRITSMISSSVGLDAEATGLRNIYTLLRMQGLEKKEIAARTPEIVEFSELGAFIHMPFKTYSAGMMARLTFAIGTELEADILLMDEWLSAGDAKFRDKASRRIESFVDAAKLLILGTHDFELVTRNCNKVLILASGRPVFFGSTEEWLAMGAFNSEAPDINDNYYA